MPYREVIPAPALRPFVDRLWMRTDPGAARAGLVRVLPDGCIDIMVDCARGTPAVAVGAMTRALVFAPRQPVALVAVRFRPGGAAPFLRLSVDELTDTEVSCIDLGVGDLIPPGLGDGEELLTALRRLEQSLLARVRDLSLPDPRVHHAVRALVANPPPSVDGLARAIGWSRQHFTRTMLATTGLGPKQLALTARMQRAVTLLQRQPRASVATVAARVGYFDQAHMAAEFRRIIGVAPREVRDARGSISPIPSLFEEA